MKQKIAPIFSLALLACFIGIAFYIGFFVRKNYRILACMSSYNRPIFVSGQVLRLLQQSYPVDISVSLKGIPDNFVTDALQKEWAPEIASGKVKVRTDINRDQYSNFLDTVRDVNLEDYDYFCKIDDDDWYSPDYFKNVNEWLNRENNLMLSYTIKNMIIDQKDQDVFIYKNTFDIFGPSMCFSRQLIKLALDIEQNPQMAEQYVPNYPLSIYRHYKEDNFLHKLSIAAGKAQERNTPVWDLIFGWQYHSTWR